MGIWRYRPKTNMMQVKGMQVSDVTDFWQVFNGCCLLRGSAVALWGCDSRDSHGFPYTLVVGSSSKSASGCPEGRDRSLHRMKQQTCSIHSTWIPLRVIAKSKPESIQNTCASRSGTPNHGVAQLLMVCSRHSSATRRSTPRTTVTDR